ncbi:MAG: hypothetical protein Q8P00_03555 [Dehalococcoidia bacterium]|nr:hypothetical protein [Dehalococcoidia bacterium]
MTWWLWQARALFLITLAAILAFTSAASAFAEAPYQRRSATVLIGDSDFGKSFIRREVLLMAVLDRFFVTRSFQRGQSMSRAAPTGSSSPMKAALEAPPQELTGETLSGADVLVLPSWSVGWVGTTEGKRRVTNDLTAAEMEVMEGWVTNGGGLLVIGGPSSAREETNLSDFLSRFGLAFDHASGQLNEEPIAARGRLHDQEYVLTLPRWTRSVAGGEALLIADGRVAGVATSFGRGRIALLGNSQFFQRREMLGQPEMGGIDQGDNMAFLVDLLAYLSGQTPLNAVERQHLAWDLRLLNLSATVAEVDIMNYKPRSPEGSDFAGARKLLAAADRGQRCDLGPGCIPFSIDQVSRSDLEQAAQFTDAALAALDQAEADLERRDYSVVERAYQESINQTENAMVSVRRVRDRYDPIGRAHYLETPIYPAVLGAVVGGCVVIGVVMLGLIRRWRGDY